MYRERTSNVAVSRFYAGYARQRRPPRSDFYFVEFDRVDAKVHRGPGTIVGRRPRSKETGRASGLATRFYTRLLNARTRRTDREMTGVYRVFFFPAIVREKNM